MSRALIVPEKPVDFLFSGFTDTKSFKLSENDSAANCQPGASVWVFIGRFVSIRFGSIFRFSVFT